MDRSSAVTPTGTLFHIPELHAETWYLLDEMDINSVYNKEMMTDAAVFVLLFQQVKEFREATKRNVSLVHISFGTLWSMDDTVSIRDHLFFDSVAKDLLLIPLLLADHFFIILINYAEKAIYIVDSKRMDILSDSEIRDLLSSLGDETKDFRIIIKKRTQICWQADSISCGVFVNTHMENYFKSGVFNGKLDVMFQRKKYGDQLRMFINNEAKEYEQGNFPDVAMSSAYLEPSAIETPVKCLKRKSVKKTDNDGKMKMRQLAKKQKNN